MERKANTMEIRRSGAHVNSGNTKTKGEQLTASAWAILGVRVGMSGEGCEEKAQGDNLAADETRNSKAI